MTYVTYFSIDAGYTVGSLMDEMTDKNLRFTGRLKENANLDDLAAPHVGSPVGRPPAQGYEHCFELGRRHQADA